MPVPTKTDENPISSPARTVIGWQGLQFDLPPDWNLVGFSMDRDNGSLRVDAPGDKALSVMVTWTNVARQNPKTAYYLLAPLLRRLLRRPEPDINKPDLRASLEKYLKEAAKQAKRVRTNFESNIKSEKTEGENDERVAINFTWTGEGRGQGKIWYCQTCHRVVVAQVMGRGKDNQAIQNVASQLFATLRDHAEDGFDRWALYDLHIDIPEDFRLESQQLKSGYLNLVFRRHGERILVERWGLANLTLKRFTIPEWFRNNAAVRVKEADCEAREQNTHDMTYLARPLPWMRRLRSWRDGMLRRPASLYEGGCWSCAESNRIYLVQAFLNRRSEEVWKGIVSRCDCH
jgi:hypothetical protein